MRILEGRFGRLQLIDGDAPRAARTVLDPSILIHHAGPVCEVQVGDALRALDRGCIVFLNPGDRVEFGEPAPEGVSRVVLVETAPEWLQDCCPALVETGGGKPFPATSEDITPRIRQLADALAIEIRNDQFLSAERLEFMVQELVLSILDSYYGRRAPAALWRGSRFEDSRIRRAIALLRARPNKDLNMDTLASRVGLSRSRFYHLFQICTGRSPRDYLDMLCVETAIERLAASNQRIADVSSNLGFSAQSNFTRFFLNQVGIPPSHYRRAAADARHSDAPAPGGADDRSGTPTGV